MCSAPVLSDSLTSRNVTINRAQNSDFFPRDTDKDPQDLRSSPLPSMTWVRIGAIPTEGNDDRTGKCLVRSAHTAAIACTNRGHLFLSLSIGYQYFGCQHQ